MRHRTIVGGVYWVQNEKYNTSRMNRICVEHLFMSFRLSTRTRAVCFILQEKWTTTISFLKNRLHIIDSERSHMTAWYKISDTKWEYNSKCDIGWYRYTSHSENHCTECDMGWYRYTSQWKPQHRVWYGLISIYVSVKTTAQSVIWADTDIRLILETTAQSVIWADTDIRLILETTAQSVIWDDENHSTECDMGWYWCTSHGENHCTACDIGWY